MKEKKIRIAMDLSPSQIGGGPYVSTSRIMKSGLKNKYDFQILKYDTSLGKGISIKRIINLKNQLKKINPDIVHFTGLLLTGFHIAVACKIAHVKNTVITIRGFSGDMINYHPVKRFLLNFLIEPTTLLLTRYFYGNSNFTANRKKLKIFKNKNLGAIYNFPPVKDESNYSIKNELNIPSKNIIIVSVARINKEKGYQVFDEAILKFQDKTNVKFLIIGKGEYLSTMQGKLKHQIDSKQVFFLGHRDDIQSILKECNIFVLPTLHETLSLALLEASVEGLALIASNTGGVPEIIENGYNGLLVEPGNINELYKALEYLIKHEDIRKEFGYNAKRKVESKFSHTVIESKIDSVYQKLLNNE